VLGVDHRCCGLLAIVKMGDRKKLEILVQNQSFGILSKEVIAPRYSERDNTPGVIMV